MFENIMKFFRKFSKKEEKVETNSKSTAKERLHLVLMQDRANVSADFLELMKQEIIEVIKKYIDVDESAIDVRLTNKENEDGTNGAPALYANIPILNIKNDSRKINKQEKPKENENKNNEEKEDNESKNKDGENQDVNNNLNQEKKQEKKVITNNNTNKENNNKEQIKKREDIEQNKKQENIEHNNKENKLHIKKHEKIEENNKDQEKSKEEVKSENK